MGNTYQVLVHNRDTFADTRLLDRGLYATDSPTLYPEGTSMDDIRLMYVNYHPEPDLLNTALANLNQCQLRRIELRFVDDSEEENIQMVKQIPTELESLEPDQTMR